jgi:hypothetical protein
VADSLRALVPALLLLAVAGLGDAQGFLHAARVVEGGRVAWDEVGRSAAGFVVGVGAYWLAVPFLQQIGAGSPLLQTLVWFGITIVGVAFVSGDFLRWSRLDQAIACAVLLGIGWLLVRTGG